LLSGMCPDGNQSRQESLGAPDAITYGAWAQDAQDVQDAESRLVESGRNTTISDEGHLFTDRSRTCQFPESQALRFQAEQILLQEVTPVRRGPQATAGHPQRSA